MSTHILNYPRIALCFQMYDTFTFIMSRETLFPVLNIEKIMTRKTSSSFLYLWIFCNAGIWFRNYHQRLSSEIHFILNSVSLTQYGAFEMNTD